MRIEVEVQNVDQLVAALHQVTPRAHALLRRVVQVHGGLLLTEVRRNASGRPGPNAPTGNYRRSWSVGYTGGGAETAAVVGTNAPQARRLEYGYHGTDALGRTYHQPPYPHAGPALDAIRPKFVAAAQAALRELTL